MSLWSNKYITRPQFEIVKKKTPESRWKKKNKTVRKILLYIRRLYVQYKKMWNDLNVYWYILFISKNKNIKYSYLWEESNNSDLDVYLYILFISKIKKIKYSYLWGKSNNSYGIE